MDILGPFAKALIPIFKAFAGQPIFWLLGVLVLLVAIGRLPVVKGWFGELLVNLQAKRFLSKLDYVMVPNVTIPDDLGGTTQIDHVVVSRFGVFVVETKNMKGWIFGGEHDREWTQKIHSGHSQKFQNPLRQNYKHTQTLTDLLALPPDKVFSVIAFVGDCTLKTLDKLPSNVRINAGWISFVKEHKAPVLSKEEVTVILERLSQSRLAPDFRTHREHVRYVKTLKDMPPSPSSETSSAPAAFLNPESAIPPPTAIAPTPPHAQTILSPSTICPLCGGNLVTRTAKRGANTGNTFLGCSNYPRCRFTGSSKEENEPWRTQKLIVK